MFDKTRERIQKLEETNETFRKVSQHVQENKRTYFVGAGMFGAGVLFHGRGEVKNIVGSFNLMYKSTATNVVVTNVTRRGHPGNIIKCIDTGEVFASQRRAAAAMGVHPYELYKHLNGDLAAAGGHIFQKIGEAA